MAAGSLSKGNESTTLLLLEVRASPSKWKGEEVQGDAGSGTEMTDVVANSILQDNEYVRKGAPNLG